MVAASLSLKQRLPDMLHRLEFHAMGCEMLAVVDSESAPLLLAKVPEWFEEWEQALSRFRFDSELMRLNRTREQPVSVSETLWDVLQTACRAEKLTDGLVPLSFSQQPQGVLCRGRTRELFTGRHCPERYPCCSKSTD